MDSSDSQPDPPELDRERVPLERKISLKFKEFRGFITEYSANISTGGMFITTDSAQPPGSVFDFEFRLADDDFQIIHGLGEVVWIREDAAGPDHPAGMGIRFLHLGEGSRDLIRRMVEEHVRSGGKPFDLEEQAPTAALSTEPPTVRTRIPADELGETRSLDLDPELEPTAPLRLGRDTEAPPREGASLEAEEIEEEAEGALDSFQRFDAAMAALRKERSAARSPDLPPGFHEVAAALRTEDAGAETVPEPESPPSAAAPAPPTPAPYEPAPPSPAPSTPDPEERTRRIVPPFEGGEPPPQPSPPVYEAHYGAARAESNRFRWFLVALALVVAAVGAAHFLVPGGLSGLLGFGSDGAPEAVEETPLVAEPAREPAETAPSTPPSGEETAEGEAGVPRESEAGPGTERGAAATERAETATETPALDPAAPLPASAAPFSRLLDVSWRREGDATVVVLAVDGGIAAGRYSHFRLGGDNPREVVRLLGVAEPYAPTETSVGTPEVDRIRAGYHVKPAGNELHLVMDLARAGAELREIRPVGSRLELKLE